LIAFEDLFIRGMIKNHCLAKHIADAAWDKLITTTSYKAEWAGKRVELVESFKYISNMLWLRSNGTSKSYMKAKASLRYLSNLSNRFWVFVFFFFPRLS